jgi:hypothetical protein
MTTYFRYYDPRFGDVYEIYTDHDGNFISAARSVEGIGREPIYYDDFNDIPPLHRNEIEQLLERNKDAN